MRVSGNKSFYIRISDRYGTEVYNLETIVAIAFRVESFGTAKVHKMLLERIMYRTKEKYRQRS